MNLKALVVTVSRVFIVFFAYSLTAWLGLKVDAVSGFATLVWPPTGLALAALLIYGRVYWPAVYAAAFFVNLITGAGAIAAAGIAVGNTRQFVRRSR